MGIQLSTLANPTSFENFTEATPFFQVVGEGDLCFPVNFAAAGINGVQDGANVTIQIVFDGGDGQLYQVMPFLRSWIGPSLNEELLVRRPYAVQQHDHCKQHHLFKFLRNHGYPSVQLYLRRPDRFANSHRYLALCDRVPELGAREHHYGTRWTPWCCWRHLRHALDFFFDHLGISHVSVALVYTFCNAMDVSFMTSSCVLRGPPARYDAIIIRRTRKASGPRLPDGLHQCCKR